MRTERVSPKTKLHKKESHQKNYSCQLLQEYGYYLLFCWQKARDNLQAQNTLFCTRIRNSSPQIWKSKSLAFNGERHSLTDEEKRTRRSSSGKQSIMNSGVCVTKWRQLKLTNPGKAITASGLWLIRFDDTHLWGGGSQRSPYLISFPVRQIKQHGGRCIRKDLMRPCPRGIAGW